MDKSVKCRNFKKIDTVKFFEDLAIAEVLDNTNDHSTLNDLVFSWNQKLQQTLDEHAPERKMKIRHKDKQPWFDNNLIASRRELRKLERIWRRYKQVIFWNNFVAKRLSYHYELKWAKINYYRTSVSSCQGNTKQLYKIIDDIMGKSEKLTFPPGYADEQQANEFSGFFSNKIESICDKLQSHEKFKVPTTDLQEFMQEFRVLNGDDLRKIIFKLGTKTCETDTIPTKFLKENYADLEDILLALVNKSLADGEFDNDWKLAIL